MAIAVEWAPEIGVKAACDALGLPRASFYRERRGHPVAPKIHHPSPRALTDAERAQVLETVNSDRFADQAPAEIYATLLDEGLRKLMYGNWHQVFEAVSAFNLR